MSETVAPVKGTEKPRRGLERAVIRFAGDSGDGMQLTGEQFTTESAWAGNDIATLPNFPAEIRAPAGTLFGVAGNEGLSDGAEGASDEDVLPSELGHAASLLVALPRIRTDARPRSESSTLPFGHTFPQQATI